MKNKVNVKRLLLILGLLLISYVLGTAVSIWRYGKIDEMCRADVAIVLGAGTSNGEMSPVFQERVNHGVWLYQNGYVGRLILTGGVGQGNEKSDAYTAKQYAMAQGVPAEDILLEEQSVITQENIANAKKLMEEYSFSTAIIVSDPLHMKRAMLMAKDYGIKAYSSPTPTTRYKSLRTKLQFLVREEFFYLGYQIYRIF